MLLKNYSNRAAVLAAVSGIALCLAAGSARAVDISLVNKNGAAATDLHITFSGPVGKLKITNNIDGTSGSADNDTLTFGGTTGWSVPLGGTVGLTGLFVRPNGKKVAGELTVTSWYWTPKDDQHTIEPKIRVIDGSGTKDVTLLELGTLGYYVGTPEPETWVLMISGFALVGAVARRRRNLLAA
jgi:hypothetical protein